MLRSRKLKIFGFLIILVMFYLAACSDKETVQSAVAPVTPLSISQSPLKKTPTAKPTKIPTDVPTLTQETGIPYIVSQIPLNTPIVDALVNPTANQLYLVDIHGQLKILNSTNYTEIASFKTDFQVFSDYVYSQNTFSGNLLSLDVDRHRLYIGGHNILILDTSSQTIIDKLNFSGTATVNPISDQIYLTAFRGDGDEKCGVKIVDVETLEGDIILYPDGAKDPPPIMGACFGSTLLDVENQMLYATGRLCSGGSSCGSLLASIFAVSEIPRYVDSTSGNALVVDPIRNRFFNVDELGYREYHISRYENSDQKISRTLRVMVPDAWSKFLYDPIHDHLYGEPKDSIFDGDLNLLMEVNFPGILLTIDSKNQIIYTSDEEGNLFILSTGFSPK